LSNGKFTVRKAAVLGAGVMGAQIAAHLANAGVEPLLFDLAAKGGDANGIALKAIANLRKLDPSPIATAARADAIQPANYDQHLALLGDCDLVIEAISERMDWKADLYKKVAPHIRADAVFASNTSGLSINQLAQALPAELRPRFCGVHFFNPPRYMHLVELIPTRDSDPAALDALEEFLVTALGKGVVRAKDTPNFIANRVGVFSMLATIHHAQRLGLGFDEVDALTGPLIGRPKSATFRTADVVGLDTFAHVVNTMRDALRDDPWHKYYQVPAWLATLIEKGALGQKTRAGIYRKVGKEIQVLDLAKADYRPSGAEADEKVKEVLKNRDAAARFAALRAGGHRQAEFLWAIYRDVFHYCAVHLESIADSARDLDFAIRWGFGWNVGPFEIWQAAGWQQVAKWIAEDIAAGKAMVSAPLPAWVTDPARAGVHGPSGSYSPLAKADRPRSSLRVYCRQLFPDRVQGEPAKYGDTVFENDGVRMWTQGDGIGIVSFRTKLHTISPEVMEGMLQAVDEAERNFAGLIVWQPEAPFSAGANLSKVGGKPGAQPPSGVSRLMKKFRREAQSLVLKAAHKLNVADSLMAGKLKEIEAAVDQFQAMTMALKYSSVPTLAAVDGLAIGGGCELAMHCSRVVATVESYIGLVEVGVGLLPAGGGCKELALRAANDARGGNIMPFLQACFQNVAMGQVAKSAEQAREMAYLRPSDVVVMNRYELLHVAKSEMKALIESGYRPPLKPRAIPVLGKTGIGNFKTAMVNMREGGYISDHDYLIGSKIAEVLCGGPVEAGSLVDEQWFLDLEKEAFMELIATQKTQERIEHMLKTGKPLRN
jgi:3-hydroxyacyl-CoA dehydrogenase